MEGYSIDVISEGASGSVSKADYVLMKSEDSICINIAAEHKKCGIRCERDRQNDFIRQFDHLLNADQLIGADAQDINRAMPENGIFIYKECDRSDYENALPELMNNGRNKVHSEKSAVIRVEGNIGLENISEIADEIAGFYEHTAELVISAGETEDHPGKISISVWT